MIKHVVLFRRLDGVSAEHPDYLEGLAALRDLNSQVPEIRDWSVLESVGGSGMWDVVLIGSFEDSAALATFGTHPAHTAAATIFGRAVEYAYADVEF